MDILVVGGAGYIGSHVCKALAQDGHRPITLDDFSSGHHSFVKWGPLIECNILNTDELIQKLAPFPFQAVIHLAARIEVAESIKNPAEFYLNNVGGTVSLLQALGKLNSNVPFVFSSTAAVYGNVDLPLIPETTPLNPINPYGTTKKLVEELLQEYCKLHEIPLCVLRYFNVAGADSDLEVGEAHHPETHLLPKLIEAALDTSKTFKLFGDDYPTPDGTCIRDYVHVSDLAQAHVRALSLLNLKPDRYCFNVGYSKGFSVKQVLSSVERVLNQKINVEIHPRRMGDPAVLVADGSAGIKILGWQPKYSNQLDQIAYHACEWQKKLIQLDLFN